MVELVLRKRLHHEALDDPVEGDVSIAHLLVPAWALIDNNRRRGVCGVRSRNDSGAFLLNDIPKAIVGSRSHPPYPTALVLRSPVT